MLEPRCLSRLLRCLLCRLRCRLLTQRDVGLETTASLVKKLAPGYKVVLLKNEFGDVEGVCEAS